MRVQWMLTMAAVAAVAAMAVAQGSKRLNPVAELLAQKQAVFGLYAPSNRRAPGSGATADAAKSPAQLAREALGYPGGDFVFDGSLEGNYEAAFPTFAEFAAGMADGGALARKPTLRLHHPLFVKTPEIAPDPAKARERIARQLNQGVAGIVFVGVESAEEARQGLAMMRFESNGGTRPNDVGDAPARWGMSEKEYRARADLWPLNPRGELVNWTIVESKEGLAHVREIAAVQGIGVLFPGAGTLRGVFSHTDANGKRVVDEAAWETAIQQVLSACKEFQVPCGYPATEKDIEMRMKQGFSVFIMGWGAPGERTIEIGRKLAGR
ncbi:MAG: aldolase/citrate lyase family protein [Gemmatimonadaceae bacterium]